MEHSKPLTELEFLWKGYQELTPGCLLQVAFVEVVLVV